MFSALKRLTGKSDTSGTNGNGGSTTEVRPGLQTMSSSLQKKFSRGVQYNMKIIIKGDRSVGKTCLFLRLQGQKFKEEYVPSDEIAVSSIQWSYKATDDVVKVEVWDVVDKGRKRRPIDGLKLANSGDGIEEPALDAEFLDVYKGTNGVIIVMDITKAWTFEYVQRELPKVPGHIPVLVLANHLDMNHHRTVNADKVMYFIESVERQAPVRYTEGSMRNGFGLRYLHKFLNVPFLQLQRETLVAQLATNDEESQLTLQELDLFQEKDEANYDKFLDNLTNRRRQAAEFTGAVGVIPQPANTQPVDPSTIKKSMSVPAQMSSVATTPIPQATAPVVPVVPVIPVATQMSPSKIIQQAKTKDIVAATEVLTLNNLDPSIVSVEEFIPDGGGLDHSFLDEATSSPTASNQPIRTDNDSESEPETMNPLVAGFQDDIDADDFLSPAVNVEDSLSNPVNIRESPASSVSSMEDLTSEVKCAPDILSDWLLPDKARRSSPEGREEGEGEIADMPHVIPRIIEPEQVEKKKKKSSKDKKEKSSDKKKSSTKEKKKKKVKKERDDLEDFLNGSTSTPVEEAYEAL